MAAFDRYIQDQLGRDEPMSADLLKAAVERGLMESQTCQFKADHGIDDNGEAKRPGANATAAAAMVNGGGGIIVYGIGRGESGAHNIRGVRYTEQIKRSLQAEIASIEPEPSYSLDLYDGAREHLPFLVLTISPSTETHWVRGDRGLPIRRGDHAMWVEGARADGPALVSAAKERWQRQRADALFRRVSSEVGLDRPWICALGVPVSEFLPPREFSRREVAMWGYEAAEAMYDSPLDGCDIEGIFIDPHLGLRRGSSGWLMGDGREERQQALGFHVQVCENGSVAYALQMPSASHGASPVGTGSVSQTSKVNAPTLIAESVNRVAEAIGACVATIGAAPGGVLLQMRPLGRGSAYLGQPEPGRFQARDPRSLTIVEVPAGLPRSAGARDLLPFVGRLAKDFVSQMGYTPDSLGHTWDQAER